MLLEFYGTECSHCQAMAPLVERLERELGVDVQKYETWHNEANARKMDEYDRDLCGGVPFFFNSETADYICGEVEYEELVRWAKGE